MANPWFFSILTLLFSALLFFYLPLAPFQKILAISSTFLNSLGTLLFMLLFNKTQESKLAEWSQKLKSWDSRRQEEEKKKIQLKTELENLTKEIDKSILLYGTVKGLGEALSWEEMVPQIDFAVKQWLGLKDYQLYLLEDPRPNVQNAADKMNFQKVLSRGSRMLDATHQTLTYQPKIHRNPNEIYLEVPIHYGGEPIALLWSRLNPIPSQNSPETVLAEALYLSEELGLGLQKARYFSSLEKLSRIDGLTGVYRRQIFNARLNEEIRRTKTFRTVFSLLIADLDHFKKINDTYGHQAGDEVLKRVGELLKENVYETDLVARYGGEEFVILFPQADPKGVKRKAEALRAKIAQEIFLLGWDKIQITMSMGIAHFPQDGTDPATLLNVADHSLYAAKYMGRNRVIDSSELRSA